MDWTTLVATLTGSILSGGLGAKLVDLKREKQAQAASAEEAARRYLAERVAALEVQLADTRERLDRAEDALATARVDAVRSDLRIQALESERDGLRTGYERLKMELAQERAMRLELEKMRGDNPHA